jgi:hypothetical protein
MSDQVPSKLFQLPEAEKKELEEGVKRLEVMKKISADLKELGIDTAQMDKDIAFAERMKATIDVYTKHGGGLTPIKKK